MTEGYDLSVFTGVICVDYELGDKKCCHILDTSDNNFHSPHNYALMKLVVGYNITSYITVITNFRYINYYGKNSHKFCVYIPRQEDTISDIELHHPNKIDNIRFYLMKGYKKNKYNPTRELQYNVISYLDNYLFIKFPKCYDAKEVMDNLTISYISYLYPHDPRHKLLRLGDYVNPSADL